MLVILFLTTSLSLSANDTIKLVWQRYANEFNGFAIAATAGQQYTIDWGDGSAIQTFTGYGGSMTHSRKYADHETHKVTIAGVTQDCIFTSFYCSSSIVSFRNQITELDVLSCVALQYLFCSGNRISNLELYTNTALVELDCSGNLLSNLNLSTNTALKYLDCNVNQLTVLDLSNNSELLSLDCSWNPFTNFDISANTILRTLFCAFNQLTNLDISANDSLIYLSCSDNLLTSLDLSTCITLQGLNCSNNLLTSLDLNTNIALQRLKCSNNLLTSLDLNTNIALQELECSENMIKNLDLSTNTALKNIMCTDNGLSNIDLNANTKLSLIHCFNNCLQLSYLYQFSQQECTAHFKCLGTQILDTLHIAIGDIIDYSKQNEFGGVATVFVVEKNGAPALQSDYSLTNGIIRFHTNGNYKITMTNPAIISHSFYPAKVIVTIIVVAEIDDAALGFLSVSAGKLQPAFASDIYDYSVNIPYNIEEISIAAIPRNSLATVSGTGTFSLEEGENIFTVTVTAEDGVTKQEYEITVNRMLGINEAIEGEDIIIYPNPTTGAFKVQEFKSSRVQSVEIFDVYGRKIQSFTPSVLQSINISGFSSGIYFIKISTETGIITKKIIKN